jgi:hypothetical protein
MIMHSIRIRRSNSTGAESMDPEGSMICIDLLHEIGPSSGV